MNKETKNAIYTGIAFVALALLISIWFGFFNKGKDFAKASGDKITTIQTQTQKLEYTDFNGTTVTGGDVIRAVRLYSNEQFTVTVKTKTNSEGKSYINGVYSVSKIDDKDYIEPTVDFTSSLDYSGNRTVNGITFTQVEETKEE